MRRETGIDIPPDAWDETRVPQYLRATIRVIDDDGAALGEGRDIESLKRQFAELARRKSRALKAGAYPIHEIEDWTFDDPPPRVRSKVGGRTFEAYTAIVDDGDTVSIELRPDEALAELETRAGVRRLCARALRGDIDFKRDSRIPRLTMLFATIGDRATLEGDLRLAVAQRACELDRSVPRTQDEFRACVRRGRKEIDHAIDQVLESAGAILTERQKVALMLERDMPPAWSASIDDIQAQLAGLVTPRFLVHTPAPWLPHVPRYLVGIQKRLEKIGNSGWERDRQRMAQLRPALAAFSERRQHLGTTARTDPALLRARWLIEELRISLFAQELRTSEPVSVERVISSVRAPSSAI